MEKKIVQCSECQKETDDWYPIFTNKGKNYKCKNCYENSIRRSSKFFQTDQENNKVEK